MSPEAWMATVTALAAVAGPWVAVWITRMSDERKEVTERRRNIFRTLMRTRKMPIHYDHVGALNLIEIEFVGDAKVIVAWKEYFKNLGERTPADLDQRGHEELRQKRETLLTKLIHEIAVALKFKVEQLEILEGNYIPQGWDDEANEQRIVRQSLIDVLGGRRPILFQPYNPESQNGPYPPAPQIEDAE
jgi:hypothetical protein